MKTDNPTLRREMLGEGLRVLRTKALLSLDEAARTINYLGSELGRVETGHDSALIEDIASLLTLYRADPTHRQHLLALARDVDELGWLQPKDSTAYSQRTLCSLQSQADQMVCFDPVVIPGALQTEEYRRAVLAGSTTGDPDDRNADSACRQPPTLLALLDECVLHRPFGGREVLHDQLGHLREVAAEPRWSIRVVPKDQTAASGPFTLLHLPARSPVVAIEHLTCRLFLERPEDIDVYERAVQHLSKNALDETESLKLISKAAEGLAT